MSRLHSIVAIVLFFVCALPGFAVAPPACAPEFSFSSISAHDVQIGQPVTITWSYSGKPVIAQTLDISGVTTGLQLGADERSYTFVPGNPGETHVQINASSGCDFVKGETQFHVRQCNIASRTMAVQDEQVLPGQPFSASVVLEKNETVRWEVRGGSVVLEDGGGISIVAGPPGTLEIDAYISRSSNCELKVSRSVPIVCPVEDIPMVLDGAEVIAGQTFGAQIEHRADQTVRWEVRGGSILSSDADSVEIRADGPGTLEIDVYVTRYGFCETKVSRSVPIVCPVENIAMELTGDEVIAGNLFGASVAYRSDQTVRWEVRGGSIAYSGANWITARADGPGTLEIDAWVSRDGVCETKISRSVPIVCTTLDVEMSLSATEVMPGATFSASLPFLPFHDVRWEVRGGTLLWSHSMGAGILAGSAGTLEIDVYISRNGYCEKKITRTVSVACPPLDVAMSLSAAQVIPGGTLNVTIPSQPGWTVRWEVTGGTLTTWHSGGANFVAGAPGTMEITVILTRTGGLCETRFTRSVPVVCDDRPLEMTLNGPQVIAGDSFGATVPHYPGQTVRWEVRGGTIKQTDLAGVSILTSAPGTLEIDAYVTRYGYCERKISRSVPIVCYSDPSRVITMQPSVTRPGGTVLAFVNVFPWFNETVRYEVRNGTITSIDGLNVWITAGTVGTLEMDAYITHGGCEFKVSKSIPVQ